MKKFPSIDQFRNIIRDVCINWDYKGKNENGEPVYSHTEPYPVIEFTGTVKLHGTNAAIVRYADGRTEYQSRERVLSLEDDNAGFMLSMLNKDIDPLFSGIVFTDYVAVYGEWCGKSIQKGVGVSELDKMFVIFAVKADDVWLDVTPSIIHERIFHVKQFPHWTMEIDFNNPALSQNRLVDLTNMVEEECPVAKHFDVIGVGEGIVWSTQDRRFCFKVKGEKHSVTKVKTLAEVDVEMVNGVNEFVEYAVTDARLQQGLDVLKQRGLVVDQRATGDFLKWIVGDVMKEETDTLVENGLDVKMVNKAISQKARIWFLNNF